MSMKKIYTCNICEETLGDPRKSYGVQFNDLINFTLGSYGCTDGRHICFGCAIQLREHLISEPISKELAAEEHN